MTTIYVLECENNKYYVGKTNNIERRINQHKKGNGSTWTNKYKVKNVLKTIKDCDSYDEDKYVIKYMAKYGVNNVRGGIYSQIKLSKEQLAYIQKQINGALDKCFKCGKSGHFAVYCRSKKCTRCGRDGHMVSSCYASTHVTGGHIDDDYDYCDEDDEYDYCDEDDEYDYCYEDD